VETKWKNYEIHGHQRNEAFDKVELLILLSAEAPPAHELPSLPRRIIHIDRRHFLKWYENAAAPEMLGSGEWRKVWLRRQQYARSLDRNLRRCGSRDGAQKVRRAASFWG
jgi:hypothetical protein